MRKLIAFPILLAAAIVPLASAGAGLLSTAPGGEVRLRPYQINAGYRQSLSVLRRAALKQQQLDGGTLTPDHRAQFQKRLDQVNDLHRRNLLNNNPLSVDANGHGVDPRTLPADWTHSRLMTAGAPN